MMRLLVVSVLSMLVVSACVTSRGLVPHAKAGLHVSTSDGAITARVKRLHLKWAHALDRGADQIVIEIHNGSTRKVRLIPKKIRLVELGKKAHLPRGEGRPKAPVPSIAKGAVEGAVSGAAGGAGFGAKLSGGSGGGSGGLAGGLAGGIGGAALGTALVVVVMIPVGAYLIGDHLARMVARDIHEGESRSLRISLSEIWVDDGHRYALDLHSALEPRPAQALGPLPLVNLKEAHGGYLSPSDLRWIWGARMGGGAIWQGPTIGGLGGVEFFFGRQWRHFALNAFAMAGLGSAGLEVRRRLPITRWFTLIPFAGYGYTYGAGRFGGAVGHGPRFGLDVALSPSVATRMGYERQEVSFGLYGHAGPIFIHERDGVGLKMQFGIVVGFF